MKPIAHEAIVKISWGILIAMGSGLIGAGVLVSQVSANAAKIAQVESDYKAAIDEVRRDQREYVRNHNEISRQLARIEERLGIVPEKRR